MSFYKADCRHFTGEKPCAPHKAEGVTCRDCPRYDPVTQRLLVIKLDAAGDVLRSTSLLPALKKAHPGAALWWVTEPASLPLLKGNPFLDVVLPTDAALPGLLAATAFHQAFNFDMGRRAAAFLVQAQSPVKKGFGLSREGAVVPLSAECEEWFAMGIDDTKKKANRRTYQEHLFRQAGLPYGGEEPQLVLADKEKEGAVGFAGKHRLSRFKKLVGFNLGAGGRWPLKRWRLDGFAALARGLRKKHPKVGILLYGGPEERDAMPALARKLKGACIPTGTDNDLRAFAALVGLCDVMVTGDTLALHVAVALRRRVVAYFGPTSEAEIDLYGRGEKVLPTVPCACYYRNECSQKATCMDHLREKDLLAAVERQLALL